MLTLALFPAKSCAVTYTATLKGQQAISEFVADYLKINTSDCLLSIPTDHRDHSQQKSTDSETC